MRNKNYLNIVIGVLLIISVLGNILQGFSHLPYFDTNFISYERFTDFFNYFNENLCLQGYHNLENNDMPQIVYIDEESSFGKRKYLTLDGMESALQTQKRIEYTKSDGSELVVIDLIYLDEPLYEDLLYWNDPLWNEENEFIKNIFTDNILSYKNMLIKLTVFSTSTGQEKSINNSLSNITREVVDFISKGSI